VANLDRYLQAMAKHGAAALLLRADAPIAMEIGGLAKQVSSRPATAQQIRKLVSEVAPEAFASENAGPFSYASPAGGVFMLIMEPGDAPAVRVEKRHSSGADDHLDAKAAEPISNTPTDALVPSTRALSEDDNTALSGQLNSDNQHMPTAPVGPAAGLQLDAHPELPHAGFQSASPRAAAPDSEWTAPNADAPQPEVALEAPASALLPANTALETGSGGAPEPAVAQPAFGIPPGPFEAANQDGAWAGTALPGEAWSQPPLSVPPQAPLPGHPGSDGPGATASGSVQSAWVPEAALAAQPWAAPSPASSTVTQSTVTQSPVTQSPVTGVPGQAVATPTTANKEDDEAPLPGSGSAPFPIDRLFNQMLDLGASDLHLKTDSIPLARIDGRITQLPNQVPLDGPALTAMISAIMPPRNRKEFRATNDTDFAYELPRARMRCNVFRDIAGIGAVFRQIPSKILTAEQLGLPQAVIDLCSHSKGLVVVTGPTGSGKSTTLAAMVDWINKHRQEHIITIEDPVEFVHEDKHCLVNQREVGVHTAGYKSALRAALREDPDIVLVGEMRDLETVEIAIETAETGHLVFGTLHTNTAPSTVDRLIDQFPTDRQQQIRLMLSESLRGVVAQTLLRKKGGGRVAALEILVVQAATANLIREGKTFQIPSIMQTGRGVGMRTMNDALVELVRDGTVEAEEAYAKAPNKSEFAGFLNRLGVGGPWSKSD